MRQKINFGYSISKDRQIEFDSNSKRMSDFVIESEPTFRICISCGSCSATCSAANFTNFNPQRLFVMVRRGEEAKLEQEFSNCMLCGKCILVCPRGVNTRNVILSIQKAIVKAKKNEI
jgi:heterodisulfide reductase subunit C